MLISIFPKSVFDNRMITVSHQDMPVEVKIWALHTIYRVTDWNYDYSDDSVTRNHGFKTVENFYSVLFDLFPERDDRLRMATVVDFDKNNISFSRISEEVYRAR